MGILNTFFKRKITKNNNVFGKLEYERGVWVHMPADLHRGFMVTVCADKNGPSEAQELFFNHIVRNIEKYEKKAKEFILTSKYLDHTDNLSIYSINIGNDDETLNHLFYLEMSDKKAEEIHIITFQDNIPKTYSVEA